MIIKIINDVNNDYDDVDISWNSSWLVAATPNCNAMQSSQLIMIMTMQCNAINAIITMTKIHLKSR